MLKLNRYTIKTWGEDWLDGFYGPSSFTASSYDTSKDETMVQLIADHMEWRFINSRQEGR